MDERSSMFVPEKIVTRQQAEEAAHFLNVEAPALSAAAAKRKVRAQEMLKVVKAAISEASKRRTVDAREAEALTSARYEAAVDEMAEAFGDDLAIAVRRRAAEYTIDAWQTQERCARYNRI